MAEKAMTAIVFDDDAHWNLDEVFFWANLDKNRIRCFANQRVILLLPGFDGARGDQMSARAVEIKRMLDPVAANKIKNNQFNGTGTIEIEESDVRSLSRE